VSRLKKISLYTSGSIGGLLLLLVIAGLILVQTSWFADFARQKLISALEESTGGRAEIGALTVDLGHLTIRIRDFVLHGTEPTDADPFFRLRLLELRVKLLFAFSDMLDLQFLDVQDPRVNVMLRPDGSTNIPQPKPTPPSQTSDLETVVNLAVKEFRITNGFIRFLDQNANFSGQGQNLRALLNYKLTPASYVGALSFDPLVLRAGQRLPLDLHVRIPLILEKDAIRVDGANIHSDRSAINVTASLEKMSAPILRAKLDARISVPEMRRTFGLLSGANATNAPKEFHAALAGTVNQKANAIQLARADLDLGNSAFRASSDVSSQVSGATRFTANIVLSEVLALFGVNDPKVSGNLQAAGHATFDTQGRYKVDGALGISGLRVTSGTTEVSNLRVTSPFHADPYLVSMDGLRLETFGGSIVAKVFLEKLQNLSAEAKLKNLSIPEIIAGLTGSPFGYDGLADGSIKANGNLKAPGASGYAAEAKLDVEPGHHGVPMSGRIDASYSGSSGNVRFDHSYLSLPNSRVDIAGVMDQRIDISFDSHNLNDLLPAVNFKAAQPLSALPVALDGGAASLYAQVVGKVADPQIHGHGEITDFSVERRPFDKLAFDFDASPSRASLSQGQLQGRGLEAKFDTALELAKWKPESASRLQANVAMHNADLAAIAALTGDSSLEASGTATTDIHVNGTYGNPLGNAQVQVIDGSVYRQPFSRFLAKVDLADQLITLSQLELDTAQGKITSNGSFRHPRESFTQGQAQVHLAIDGVQLAGIEALARQNAGISGVIHLTANSSGNLSQKAGNSSLTLSNLSADLSASDLRIQNQDAGRLTAVARTQNGKVSYNLDSDLAGSDVKVHGATALTGEYATTAEMIIRNLSVQKALQLASRADIPVKGDLTADANVNGTLANPNGRLQFKLSQAALYEEPINSFQGQVSYSNRAIEIPNINLDTPAGSVALNGSFNHPVGNMKEGSLQLKLTSSDMALEQVQHIRAQKAGFGGVLKLAADLSATLRDDRGRPQLLISKLNANVSADRLHLNEMPLGGIHFAAGTTGSKLDFRVDGDLARSQIHGNGHAELTGDYPLQAKLAFNNIRYSNVSPLLSTDLTERPSFEALVEGEAGVNGPAGNLDHLKGQLQLNRLSLETNSKTSVTGGPPIRAVKLQNKGPILLAMSENSIQIRQLEISGRDTSIKASGSVNLSNPKSPLSLTLRANLDLGLLQDANRDFYSSGSADLDTTIRGSFAQPVANGKIQLKNASLNYAQMPNGISNANGIILLNGTNASIQNLSGESGGGKVDFSGFVGLGNRVPNFNLKATASNVRVRYSGISATSDGSVTLIGNIRRSLLSGTISIERLEYASSSDAGSLLSAASTPPTAPSAPSPFLAGMRLDVRILTAPNIQVSSTYANRLSVLANLTVRGTATSPGMLGRVTVTDGQLVFFGNTYTVTTGTINFYDPDSISPVLNISLDTEAQGVNVTIGVTGPMDDLKLSYRSDPPLTFEQIVQLLATNTTPANPVIAAHQPAPRQESVTQMGESALIGQAVANPLASRVQRVFGLSQFKIDPSISNAAGPSARVTLQEKITSNITFTYISDISQINGQIIRIEWDLTNNLSIVGLRDYNANVSIEVFYTFTRR
jgi:translocation and assembly module TamB